MQFRDKKIRKLKAQLDWIAKVLEKKFDYPADMIKAWKRWERLKKELEIQLCYKQVGR